MTKLIFIITLAAISPVLAQAVAVTVTPLGQQIVAVGDSARFVCAVSPNGGVVGVQWLANQTLLMNSSTTTLRYFGSGFASVIFFGLNPEFNGTRIECRPVYNDGREEDTTGSSLLLLQGLLDAVVSLELSVTCSAITLAWTPPFSLNILGVDPDIAGYCVDVFTSMTTASPALRLHSECNITRAEFAYTMFPVADSLIQFTVTPVNVVGNGTSSVVEYRRPSSPEVAAALRVSISSYLLFMSAPVCHANVTLVDVDTSEIITPADTDLTITGTNISITQLTENHRYSVVIAASNIGSPVVSQTRISTHDIQSVSSKITGQGDVVIAIETNYLEHYSTASGALYIFVPLDTSGGDNARPVYLALGRNISYNHTLPFGLRGGRILLFVYDIEGDGTLASGVGYPAVSREIVTTDTQGAVFRPSYSFLEECHAVITSFGVITVECTYPNTSNAIGFQILAQLSNPSALMHRLYVNKTTDGQTSASVVVEESGMYQVIVFPVSGERGILDSGVEYMHLVMIDDAATTTNTFSTTRAVIATAANTTTIDTISVISPQALSLGMGLGMGILALVTAVLVVIVILQYFKPRCNRIKAQAMPNVQLEQPGEGVSEGVPDSQIYEEIKTLGTTEMAALPREKPAPVPEYEDVKPAATDGGSKSSDSYQITQCSAYGVSYLA